MNIFVIGSGGREHALVWKIAQSRHASKIYCAPGNGGISQIAECVPVKVNDIEGLLRFAKEKKIDLTVVGSEEPLTLGIADEFTKHGLGIFGPSAKAAEIEGSKVFSKQLMKKYNVPTAGFEIFSDSTLAKNFVQSTNRAFVVKADGLAAGKGVIVAADVQETLNAIDLIMSDKKFGSAGNKIIIEEKMAGEEASVFAITDGEGYVLLPAAQDHKRIFDGDRGGNTGGMGAYAPAPVVTPEIMEQVERTIIRPVIQGMASEGRLYKGVLYCGLMLTNEGPKVVEFNCRFGDPECQVLMPLIDSDVVELFLAVATNQLNDHSLRLNSMAATCVVLASGGYPDLFEKGKTISGLEKIVSQNAVVFHAGTQKSDGKFITSGGRVLGVTAFTDTIASSIQSAYETVGHLSFEGMHFRKDIGHRALKRMGQV
ncbi:phosphoribosylamine--glycine ligase [bacterium]|nr:phosphoribosylamine--glycine ligase [bacterium]